MNVCRGANREGWKDFAYFVIAGHPNHAAGRHREATVGRSWGGGGTCLQPTRAAKALPRPPRSLPAPGAASQVNRLLFILLLF